MMTIGAVSCQTGIPAATLRKWGSRYGFPAPQRSPGGQRVFCLSDVDRVLEISRRIANGQRPGEAAFAVRQCVPQSKPRSLVSDPSPCAVDRIQALDLLVQGRFSEFERFIENRLAAQGIQNFTQALAVPLMDAVGVSWQAGLLPVYAEHIFSSVLQAVVTRSVRLINPLQVHCPRVLLATPSGEMHKLALVLLNAMLNGNNNPAVFLQGGLPASEIACATEFHDAQVLALSASVVYPPKLLKSELFNLRELLPRTVEISVGGGGTHCISTPMDGIAVMTSMEVFVQCLRNTSDLSASRDRNAPAQSVAPITLKGKRIDLGNVRPADVACHWVVRRIQEQHSPNRSGRLIYLHSRSNQQIKELTPWPASCV
jgi:DNA-binding transcriptional MerR regulator